MKIFDDNSGWGKRVNFVDHNNVFVGYDMEQDCCEDFGWYIQNRITGITSSVSLDLDFTDYVFDTKYIKDVVPEDEYWDMGGIVAFKLIADGKPDMFLHLYNSHNGYYSHGFDVKENNKVIEEGYL